MTQLQSARQGVITPEMAHVAVRDCVAPDFLRREVEVDVSESLRRDGSCAWSP